MPDIFDSIESFFRSLFHGDDDYIKDSSGKRQYYDPDMQDAWDELEEYLREGKNKPKPQRPHHDTVREQKLKMLRAALKNDYAILKVPFDASFEQVKKSYKTLLRQYHPDRFARDPERFKTATEITQKINQSFQKIEAFEEQKKKL
jgi:DnaJ-domain-containing protein 1